jgi:hypothetical protein
MRSLLIIAVLFALLGLCAAGGASYGQFQKNSPLQKLTLPVKYINLEEQTLPVKMLQDVVKTKFIDQEILQPKLVKQPIIQQRLVEQPIVRTRIVHQPILRRVYTKNIVRPHVVAQERLVPVYKQQDVLVPKIVDQTIVKEEFKQETKARPTLTMPTTFQGKSRQQLYGQQSPRFKFQRGGARQFADLDSANLNQEAESNSNLASQGESSEPVNEANMNMEQNNEQATNSNLNEANEVAAPSEAELPMQQQFDNNLIQ